jgi:hypothetical protein
MVVGKTLMPLCQSRRLTGFLYLLRTFKQVMAETKLTRDEFLDASNTVFVEFVEFQRHFCNGHHFLFRYWRFDIVQRQELEKLGFEKDGSIGGLFIG